MSSMKAGKQRQLIPASGHITQWKKHPSYTLSSFLPPFPKCGHANPGTLTSSSRDAPSPDPVMSWSMTCRYGSSHHKNPTFTVYDCKRLAEIQANTIHLGISRAVFEPQLHAKKPKSTILLSFC